MQPTAIDIECSSSFPFFDDKFKMKLKSKLPHIYRSVLTHMKFQKWKWCFGTSILRETTF